MRSVRRLLLPLVREAAESFPAVVLTGPRRAGKTFLLRQGWPRARYVLLEDPFVVTRIRSDPGAFLGELTPPVILDEIQNAPELFPHIRSRIDLAPRRKGPWLITGSQEAPLMEGVTESMAGRAAILQLLPLSTAEVPRVDILAGGYPEAVGRVVRTRRLWFDSYIQTYLERDVRAVTAVRDLATFRRFLALLASRHGQVLNRTDLAGPLGVSLPTITEWLRVLEVTAQIILVPPYFENFGKRLTKSPKIYIGDSGLACHLLGVETSAELEKSPFLGALYQGYVASEILKSQTNRGGRKELYHFRDQQGLEVDFLFPHNGRLRMVECKASRTPTPQMASRMLALAKAVHGPVPPRLTVVHRPSREPIATRALAPGAEAMPVTDFVAELNRAEKRRTRRAAG